MAAKTTKVYLPNDSKMSVGGGWTFRNNLVKGAKEGSGLEIVNSLEEADISLISGATMILPETFTKLKESGKKVVLRVDGVPELWRNDKRTWERFKKYWQEADGVIYQSDFTFSTTGLWLTRLAGEGQLYSIIYNGVDKDIFNKEGEKADKFGSPAILHVNSRKDPNKRVEEVIERFRTQKLINPTTAITFAGKYPTYLKENAFGMYDYQFGKDYRYVGVYKEPEKIAKLMRSADEFWFPSFADPCPNVLIEALHCGVDVRATSEYGSTREIVKMFYGGYDFSLEAMAQQYLKFFVEVLS